MELPWMFFGLSPTTVLLIGIVLVLCYLYSTWNFSTFKKMGIPGPPPWPIIGNMQSSKGIQHKEQEWIKEYGKVFGTYEGRQPVINFADPEICKQITVKHFSSFVNRRVLPLNGKPMNSGLTVLVDDQWKRARNTLTPAFSGAKMRMMAPLINQCANELVANMETYCKEEKVAQCKDLYGGFVVDSIASAGFGLDVSSQSQPGHPFVENAKLAFKFSLFSPVFVVVFFFPFLVPLLNLFDVQLFPKKVLDYFVGVTEDAIEMRKPGRDSSNRIDFLQLMVNAHEVYDQHMANKDKEIDEDEGENKVDFVKDGPSSQVKLQKGFTKDEMLAQSLLFFLAGYETTSTLMSFVSYSLATNPEVQNKLHSEIDDIMSDSDDDDDIGYETLKKMTYLDMVVTETLRMYPPAIRFDRECNEDVNISGVSIPKGMIVAVSIYAIHHDPEIYPEPEKFIPERFTKEEKEKRHPYAWIPFGAGPRNCIGMRFALMEAKIGLVRVLQKFTFEPCAETEIPPKLGKLGFLTPPNGIKLSVKRR
ncbi:cytochrome P450 3A24-like [Saccoglossus kowalevskii]|uniref:Cytochrome P450 3A24-like n=1 Tax=Saccoglossus kowalevskii TaxID=10224 RepID=A0ABM0GIK2_SACKO|nr:PREDICTED: cytochrome P450 3A24-like [Saccoglossus kowalevskii]